MKMSKGKIVQAWQKQDRIARQRMLEQEGLVPLRDFAARSLLYGLGCKPAPLNLMQLLKTKSLREIAATTDPTPDVQQLLLLLKLNNAAAIPASPPTKTIEGEFVVINPGQKALT
jgi:hypothetical protein